MFLWLSSLCSSHSSQKNESHRNNWNWKLPWCTFSFTSVHKLLTVTVNLSLFVVATVAFREKVTWCSPWVPWGHVNLVSEASKSVLWWIHVAIYIPPGPIRGEMMKWLRVQRNTIDSLFKDPQRVLIVLAKMMKEQVDAAGRVLGTQGNTFRLKPEHWQRLPRRSDRRLYLKSSLA